MLFRSGRDLEGNEKSIMPAHRKVIQSAPKPATLSEMLTFLGVAGHSRQWICDFALKTARFHKLIHSAGQQNMKRNLVWDDGAEQAFVNIKIDLGTGSALASPH